jgi:O-antigen biosynthesis protein
VPRLFKSWAEAPRSSSDRLTEIESSLRTTGAIVSRGGDYDRWDLEARKSFIGAVRIRLGLEEHGAGRQLVRVHVAPSFSSAALGLVVVLGLASLVASLSHAYAAAILIAMTAVLLGICAVQSAGRAMAAALPSVLDPAKRRRPAQAPRELSVKRT